MFCLNFTSVYSILICLFCFMMDETESYTCLNVFLFNTSLLLLSLGSVGGLVFTQALGIVGCHDTLLKERLVAVHWAFAASGFCSYLGTFMYVILPFRREYHPYKRFFLITGITSSLLCMVLAYGLLLSFMVQRLASCYPS
ncbi:hypothetical protein MKX03_026694 [Papaver bracteatum]|nr:hypothetical protein MKX03_026694 [Papaver bracteatum]